MENRFITKQDFINYFKYPKPFWFLVNEEIESLFNQKIELESELDMKDYFQLLREIVESPESLVFSNSMKLNKLKDKKLIAYYKKYFSIPNLSFYDHSQLRDEQTEYVKERLSDPDKSVIFFYKPTLVVGNLKVKPTAIYKYNNKIYLIEHYWSTTLKKESLASFIFYNYIFKNYIDIKIDQYLITFLSDEPSPNKELILKICNGLPYKAKVKRPSNFYDENIKNINNLFGLEIEYGGSLYEKIFPENKYEAINNEEWEIDDDRFKYPDRIIDKLNKFLENENREVDLNELLSDFLNNKKDLVSSSNPHYRLILQHIFPNFTYSSSLLPLNKSVRKMFSSNSEREIESFIEFTSNLKFLSNFPEDQDYIIFQEAITKFNDLREKNIKVYYDFESLSLPFPYLENTKPYMQIVLQLSLIVVRNGVEEKPSKNLIIDPLELSLDSFKQIIDAIYIDEPGVAYIVYNKSFENTRLKEMANLINESEYLEKVISIIDRTVDLADWFFYGNNPHIVHKKLKGFHSIKKVNKLIPRYIEEMTGTKKYEDLKKCQNGVMAQALLLSRALVENRESDEDNWRKNKAFMYSYCENDVRSMIAVEMYIDKLINENKYPVFDVDKFNKEKLNYKRQGVFVL